MRNGGALTFCCSTGRQKRPQAAPVIRTAKQGITGERGHKDQGEEGNRIDHAPSSLGAVSTTVRRMSEITMAASPM